MCNPLLPALFLVIVPLGYFAYRLGLFESRIVRVASAVLVVGLTLLDWPVGGMDALYLERVKLLLSGWVIAMMVLRTLRVPWWMQPRNYRAALVATALVGAVVYLNFLSFHGLGTWLHVHEGTHYYLGAKYFPELGYGRLYAALLAAETEDSGGKVFAAEVRDLSTNRMVPVVELQPLAWEAQGRFSPDRWKAFREDSRYFRERLGQQGYELLLTDHGFNPTPAWALFGSALANFVPAGSERGILLLTFIDPVLQIAAFAAIGWAFGLETACVALLHFCLIFGTSFDWIGGGYLRYLWFASLVTGVSCLHRGRYRTAGALIAVASLMRIFPIFFVAGIAAKALQAIVHERRLPDGARRFAAGFGLATAAIGIATLLPSGGLGHWVEFLKNAAVHTQSLSSNFVGMTNLISYWIGADLSGAHQLGTLFQLRGWVHGFQLAVLFPLVSLFVWLVSRRVDEVTAAALGTLLIVTTLNLAGYYYSFLVLLVLAHRRQPGRLALIFSIELATYALHLFEEHLVMLFLYRGLMVTYLVVALHFDDIVPEAARMGARSRAAVRPAA